MHSKPIHTIFLSTAVCCLLAQALAHGGATDETKAQPNSKRLLIISLDGFRYDYLDLPIIPKLSLIAKQGVRAKSMQSAYITKTFPNHYTIASGLYEESHGIVGNTMWDPGWNQNFSDCSTPSCGKWYGGVPIWQANEDAEADNEKVRASGMIHWPGTGAKINNVTVTHEQPYPSKINGSACADKPKFRKSIDQMIDWFMDEEKPLNLGMIYHQEPDCTNHKFGPESQETRQVLKGIDEDIGYLLDELDEHELDINIVILSDHGFANVSGYVYLLEDCGVDVTQLENSISNSPVISLWPKNEDQLKDVKSKLESCSHDHQIHVYQNSSSELISKHYSNNSRIAPLIVTTYHTDNGTAPLIKFSKAKTWTNAGSHGWNNSWLVMHAFFIARGPRFKTGYVKDTFSNIHVFSLFCSILDISDCPQNNGSLSAVDDMLTDIITDPPMSAVTLGTLILVALFCAIVSGLMSIGACRLGSKSRFTKSHSLLPQRHEKSELLPNGLHPETSEDEF